MIDYKWHYYHHDNDICNWEDMKGMLHRFTICGRDIHEAKRHTEFKGAVNCLICLHNINLEDENPDENLSGW